MNPSIQNHCLLASEYHRKGYNCAQSVLAAFSDRTGLDEETALSLGGSFGMGAGSGELCGAVSGALMVLGMLTPVDTGDPAGSKLRSVALGRGFVRRFSQRFGGARCTELLEKPVDGCWAAAGELGIGDHCSILAAAAAEMAEELLEERRQEN